MDRWGCCPGPGPARPSGALPCTGLRLLCSRELAQAFLPAAAEVRARLGRRAVPATAPRRGLCPHVQTILGLRLQRAAPSRTVPHSQPARPSHVSVLQSQMPAALLDSMEWVARGPPRLQLFLQTAMGPGPQTLLRSPQVLFSGHVPVQAFPSEQASPTWGPAPSSLRRGPQPVAPPARQKVHLPGGWW